MQNVILIFLLLLAACRCKEDPCENNTCANGNICNQGKCECPPELVKLGQLCLDLKTEGPFSSRYINYLQSRCMDTFIVDIKYSEKVDAKNLGATIIFKNDGGGTFMYDLYKKPDGDSIYSYFFIWPGRCLVNGQPGFANLHAKFSPDKKVLKGEMYWYYYTTGVSYAFHDKYPVLFTKEK